MTLLDSHFNILRVPTITKNLISVGKFARDNNVFFEFHSHTCYVKSQGDNRILLEGKVSPEGLCFSSIPCTSQVSISQLSQFQTILFLFPIVIPNVQITTSYYTWHCRLGHPNDNIVKTIFNRCNITQLNKNVLDFCTACCFGKSNRLPSHASTTTYNTPFELLFLNLWGPAPIQSSTGLNWPSITSPSFYAYKILGPCFPNRNLPHK